MASNVFGEPITNSTLEGMLEYTGKVIRRIDRAHVALNTKNADDKGLLAKNYVQQEKDKWGNGISALCLIYNASGDPIRHVTDHDWHGHMGAAPYPVTIENGQWGAFLHVKGGPNFLPPGASGAIVYRAKNNYGTEADWMVSWAIPFAGDNAAYSEIRDAGHFDDTVWGVVSDKMDRSGRAHTEETRGFVGTVVIGEYTSPVYEAILTLENADNPPPR